MKKFKKTKNEKEYIPINLEKYCGQYPIIVKSSWEEKFCRWLDLNKEVVEWSSESIRIPYIDPTKGKRDSLDPIKGKKRIYYPDFYIKYKNGKKFIVEIKPEKDLRMPKNKSNKSIRTIITRKNTFLINEAKFKSAKEYCKKFGYEFLVLTEKDLFRR